MAEENGNGKITDEEKAKAIDMVPEKEAPCPDNEAFIEGNVMTVKIYLWGDAAFAKSIGAMELAKDLVKSHFGAMAMRKQMERPRIIKPPTIH